MSGHRIAAVMNCLLKHAATSRHAMIVSLFHKNNGFKYGGFVNESFSN